MVNYVFRKSKCITASPCHSLNWSLIPACCGLFGFVSEGFKTQGVILVELQEMFPEESAESILWVFSLTMLMNRGTGEHNFSCGSVVSGLL